MNLKKALQKELSKDEAQKLVRSFDVVGDIAIIIIPQELEEKQRLIGEAILSLNKKIKVVAKRVGIYDGEFRTVPLEVIAGKNRLETEHREYGVRFMLDPGKVYFSVRLSTERKRIADCVKKGEHVLVFFSGIGAFPLVIAGNSKAKRIVGVEKNPAAHEYALRSLALNRKINNVEFSLGDAAGKLSCLDYLFDRVLMPLPKSADLFLDRALPSLKPGGMIHFYSFGRKGSVDEGVEHLRAACRKNNREIIDPESIVCGHCGPNLYRICVDAGIG